jgi:hypothetical protein
MITGMTRLLPLTVLLIVASLATAAAAAPKATAIRCPNDGLQPQAAVDAEGTVHLVYLKGEDAAAVDVFYVTSRNDGQTWSAPLRVNSQPGAAIATGTVRGAHLALGKGGRPHVAWMGSKSAEPRAVNGATPMLYARLNDAGDAFEPQRNLITTATGLDGGGTVAADGAGNVHVAWHAPTLGKSGEENRTVWLTTSRDDGQTFGRESQMLSDPTGVCGCCAMSIATGPAGELFALYRSANSQTRDIHLLSSAGRNERFHAAKVETLATKTCPMSTAAFARANDRLLAAWEGGGQVSLAPISPDGKLADPAAAPGKGNNRKHPAIATNGDGVTLLAWSEGTGWKRGGAIAWQLYDASQRPLTDARGTQAGLVAWSKPAAFPARDGSFVILY